MAQEHETGDAGQASPADRQDEGTTESKLKRIPEGSSSEAHQAENAKNDREVASISRTVHPKSDAPSRSGIKGSGSGADT